MPQVLANGWCCLPGMVAVSGAGAPTLRSALNSDTCELPSRFGDGSIFLCPGPCLHADDEDNTNIM